ncbi:MAG: trypsin-like peptidase domain-containing protein [candidate division Zixibacteria bacterium]|nr:trypsin-like peptidase domain-containing protein [candidate division Zixibacteria bacterium]
MIEAKFPSGTLRRKGLNLSGLTLIAIACVLMGIIISSNLELPSVTFAQSNNSDPLQDRYPVVERNGVAESPFVSVVEKVQDAVVNISARSKGEEMPWWVQGSEFNNSFGSGFFFREDGYILTNAHVVRNAVELTVRTATGYEYPAKIVGIDPSTDLAVIKVEPEEKIHFIEFGDSENLKVGDWAIAIGNPFPQQGLDRTVTVGVISAKGRSNLRFGSETPQYQNYIQTDASINPGNSGGPLLNLYGEVIGVNAAISSPTGSSVGIGFAIPINMARAIVPDLIASGKVSRGWLGVWLSPVTAREAKRQQLGAVKGVRIDSVFANSPAKESGVKTGDIVVSFNNQEVQNVNQFSVLVSTVRNGMEVPIEIVRDSKRIPLVTTVADRDAYEASARASAPNSRELSNQQWLGMEFTTFTPEMAAEISVRHVEGVFVTRVHPGTPADKASIIKGTVILQADNQAVESAADMQRIASQIGNNPQAVPLIVVEPGGSIARKVIRP